MKQVVKRGMASLYLVAFTTLLLGIISVSFVEVMINESSESSNSDLSQSAFDSALAGIEDAKNAIIYYNSCLTMGDGDYPKGSSIPCSEIKARMAEGRKTNSCDTVSNILNKEVSPATDIGDDSLAQAYTCVTISNDPPDYRAVLDEEVHSRTVPMHTIGENYETADSDIVAVEFEWHSNEDYPDSADYMSSMYTSLYNSNIIPFGTNNDAVSTIPPIAFEFFQTDPVFTMTQLDLNNDTNTGTDHGMILLYPDGQAPNVNDKGTIVTPQDLLDASSKSNNAAIQSSSDKSKSVVPKLVYCGFNSGFRCRATIQLPATYNNTTTSYSRGQRANSTFLVRISLPYGESKTDFSIKPCTSVDPSGVCNGYAVFDGIQYVVDSTGRANTLYRRLSARIDSVANIMFPEYAIQVSGSENSTIEKRFYVTNNCWFTDGKGNSSSCANNGDAPISFP